jgi:hypothetical protein
MWTNRPGKYREAFIDISFLLRDIQSHEVRGRLGLCATLSEDIPDARGARLGWQSHEISLPPDPGQTAPPTPY